VDETLKRILRWRQGDDQDRTQLEKDLIKISEYIIDNADLALQSESESLQEQAYRIVFSVKGLLEELKNAHQFLKGDSPTISGKLFVHKILFVVAMINDYISTINNNRESTEKRQDITWICSAYCKALCFYGSKLARP